MALTVQDAKEGHGPQEGRRDAELRAGRAMIGGRTRAATFVPDRRRAGEHERGQDRKPLFPPANHRRSPHCFVGTYCKRK